MSRHDLTIEPEDQQPRCGLSFDGVRARSIGPGPELQYAALPYRVREELEILLITSRETGRWVLPKGWPMKGKKAHAAAACEALEEAGVKGKIGKCAIGAFSYEKRRANGTMQPCTVQVYPLAVDRQFKRWPEQAERTRGWFTSSEAADLVQEAELSALIGSFAVLMAG